MPFECAYAGIINVGAVVGNDLLPVVLVCDGHHFFHRRASGNAATCVKRALAIRHVADNVQGLLDLQELHDGLVDENDCDQRRERLLRETRYVRHPETTDHGPLGAGRSLLQGRCVREDHYHEDASRPDVYPKAKRQVVETQRGRHIKQNRLEDENRTRGT